MDFRFMAWDIESPMLLTWEEIQDIWETEGYHNAIFNQDHYICLPSTTKCDIDGTEIYAGHILESLDGIVKLEVLYDTYEDTAEGNFIGFALRSLDNNIITQFDDSYKIMRVVGDIFTWDK